MVTLASSVTSLASLLCFMADSRVKNTAAESIFVSFHTLYDEVCFTFIISGKDLDVGY